MRKQKLILVCSNSGKEDALTIECDGIARALGEALAKIVYSDEYDEVKIVDKKGREVMNQTEICEKLGIEITEFTTDICTFVGALSQ
ncbi:hypothetical protein K8R32_04870 [bacterium]|nr:hypothetical protein [bacterium]